MKYEYKLVGLDCVNCANKIQNEISKIEGIYNVNVNFAKLKLSYESDKENLLKIKQIIKKIEPEVEIININSNISTKASNKNIILQIVRLITGIAIALIGSGINKNPISTILIVLGYVILLYRTTKNAIKLLVKSKTINENLLITISCIGAYLVGKHMEGLMVITLYEIGKILEEKAVNKTRKSISDLMNIKSEYANIKQEDSIRTVKPEEVNIGDIIVIKPGEKIPLDGIIIKGMATLNTASLTGESKPQSVKVEDKVLSGSIVLDGLLEVKVTERYENSTVNRILELVENATDKKAKTETFVNKAAKIYTPIVLIIATFVAVFLPLITKIGYNGTNGSIYRALIFLVISCPCAIAISVPLCYFSGIGKSSKNGILIKGSDYLDGLKDVKEIVFDKTGTLTTGEFSINKIEMYSENYKEEDVLYYAAVGEYYSNHPIAKSITKAYKGNISNIKIERHEEIAGKGLKYFINEKEIFIGNNELIEKKEKDNLNTNVYVKVNGEVIGVIKLQDEVKSGIKDTINELNKRGIISKMFTGDNQEVANEIANQIGIKEVKANLLPNDKYLELQKLLKNKNGKIAFVGDGINDSPVLALADIGISMGGVGSSSAIEASDIVIMTDSVNKIKDAIDISIKTNKIIKQNLIFSIGIKVLVLILSVFGIANMWEAVFADVGATLITILNTLRILK